MAEPWENCSQAAWAPRKAAAVQVQHHGERPARLRAGRALLMLNSLEAPCGAGRHSWGWVYFLLFFSFFPFLFLTLDFMSRCPASCKQEIRGDQSSGLGPLDLAGIFFLALGCPEGL